MRVLLFAWAILVLLIIAISPHQASGNCDEEYHYEGVFIDCMMLYGGFTKTWDGYETMTRPFWIGEDCDEIRDDLYREWNKAEQERLEKLRKSGR
jgi:hypothetical protein